MKNIAIGLLLITSNVIVSCGQDESPKSSGFVQYNSITADVHKRNIGKITFTSRVIPLKDYNESDFLTSYEIEEESELYIEAFLGNSLTNYLHELDKSLTPKQLVENGNYQFSFYIDGELLYTENLNAGAGSVESKDESTILLTPLLSEVYTDYWSRFMWMRFFHKNGGKAALATGSHNLKIEIRPYLELNEVIVGDVIAEGEIILKLAEKKPVTEEQIAIQKIKNRSGWNISNANFDREKIRSLNEKIAQKEFKAITSIVVVKDSELLIEEYFNDSDRNTLHDTRSVGKSFASTVMGIAIEEGYIKNTDQTLSEFYDLKSYENYSAAKEQVTLKSLLTMSSGFNGSDDDYDSPGNEENMYPTENWVKFTLDLSMDDTKEMGKNWDYFTAGVVVLGDIIHQSVPGGLEKYADEKLFKPLGITNYQWQYTPQDVANTAGGLQMRSLDYAKYAQLYKNRGMWNGAKILTSDWVDQTFTNHFADDPEQTPYGFLFWRQIFEVEDQSYKAFLCSGNGGNKIIVFDDLPFVIVVTARAYGRPYMHTQVKEMLENYLLPSLIN